MSRRDDFRDIARSVPFDNSSNGFTSEDVQAAIEEAKNTAPGGTIPSAYIPFITDAGADNKWFKVVDHHQEPSNVNPYICPQSITVKGLTFINKKDNTGNDFEIYKNGVLVYTWQVRNARYSYRSNFAPLSFNAGDRMSLFCRAVSGQSQSDTVTVMVYFTVNSFQSLDVTVQTGV